MEGVYAGPERVCFVLIADLEVGAQRLTYKP